MQRMTIYGVSFDMVGKQPIVLLKTVDGNKFLPIWIGHPEAAAILMKLQGASTPRPMTHDLLRNLIVDLGGVVDRVIVSDLRDATFFATICLTVKGESITVDARPSDAIALALRAKAPILVESSVVEAAKASDIVPERDDNGRLSKWLESLDLEEFGKYRM